MIIVLFKCLWINLIGWWFSEVHNIAKFMGPTWGPSGSCRPQMFMGPTWGPSGSCRPQMGPMLAPWTLLSGIRYSMHKRDQWEELRPVHCCSGRVGNIGAMLMQCGLRNSLYEMKIDWDGGLAWVQESFLICHYILNYCYRYNWYFMVFISLVLEGLRLFSLTCVCCLNTSSFLPYLSL